MKSLVFLLLAVVIVSTSAIDLKRRRINKPYHEVFRKARSPQDHKVLYTKGGTRTQNSETTLTTLPQVRKGEYLCGNKVCKLRAGEVPLGCNGVCQYRVH